MNIGIFISPRHSVPSSESQHNLAWDTAGLLVDGLVAKKHNVVLFAAVGSETKAKLIHFDTPSFDGARESYSPAAYRQKVAEMENKMFGAMLAASRAFHFDVIHVHEPTESLADIVATTPRTVPLVFTLHEPILTNRLAGLEKLGKCEKCFLVTVSNAQRDGFALPFAETVPTGIPLLDFPMGDGSDQLMVAGRVAPEKGFEDAIKAASRTNTTLVVAGKVYQSLLGENSYFREKIEPRLYDAKVIMKQFLTRPELAALYGASKAFLYPTKWEEPFGVVMLEAMAAGTPVIAYNRGCVSELVVDGVTGFVVDPRSGVDGLVKAIGRISEIKRENCRRHVEDHFSIEKMTDSYLDFYKKILAK